MRVSQISVCNQQIKTLPETKRNCCPRPRFQEQPPKDEIQFKGKFGAWVGGIVGGVAVLATAIVAAPAAACLIGGGAIIGAIGGDVAEDAVNKTSDNDNK